MATKSKGLWASGSMLAIATALAITSPARAGEASGAAPSPALGTSGGTVASAAAATTSTPSSSSTVSAALPTGAVVKAGGAVVTSPSASALTITQSTSRAVIDWQSFSIGAGNSVSFVQPGAGSATLNRVVSSTPSSIAGDLSANGSVYLINPNGIEITKTGTVRVGGGFVASSLDIADQDFMAGKLSFTGNGAGVSNSGSITGGTGAFVALLGGYVSNDGVISAPLGKVALGSGQAATLDLNGDRFLQVTLPADATDAGGALISVNGRVSAAGGRIEVSAATARDAVREAVNIPGELNASSVTASGGKIILDGSDGEVSLSGKLAATGAAGSSGGSIALSGDVVVNSGVIDASGGSGGQVSATARVVGDFGQVSVAGDTGSGGTYTAQATETYLQVGTSTLDASGGAGGGTITVQSGGSLFTSGQVVAASDRGAGGHVDLFGSAIDLIDAHVDASGASAGGQVRIGGDGAGAGSAPHAQTVRISGTTEIDANATASGLGGHVVVWSDTESRVSGTISAKGGSQGGDGGQVEISSAGQVGFSANVDVTAAAGKAGLLTLDPKFIIIEDVPPQGLGYDLLDPMPATGNNFAANAQLAVSGDLAVVSDPTNSAIASHNGAVYVINVRTGAVVSALLGSHANDGVGAQTTIGDTTAYVQTPTWNSGRGAFTRFTIDSAPNGIVSASNSLVGSTPGDHVGAAVVQVDGTTAGGLLIGSPDWSNGAAAGAGALTYAVGTANPTGVVSASNSLVGSTAGDNVGLGINASNFFSFDFSEQVINGVFTFTINPDPTPNFAVISPNWHAGAAGAHAGAVTMFTYGVPIVGTLSTSNSLVGSQANDNVGSGGLTISPDFTQVLISSPNWNNGVKAGAGAITWAKVDTPAVGAVSAGNSLVGGTANDHEGLLQTTDLISNVIWLTGNGNFIITNHAWTNPTTGAAGAGAATWGSGTTGVSGVVTAANSIVGSSAGDEIANVLALDNGNYVVASPTWTNTVTGATFAGAVTWGNGATGTSGAVSAANSIVGTQSNDFVGGLGHYVSSSSGQNRYPITIYSLGANGNYIVSSNHWNGNVGAVTWVNGATGQTMNGSNTISIANSLTGGAAGDRASFRNFGSVFLPFETNFFSLNLSNPVGVTLLNNGNYVIDTTLWNGSRGAVTFGNGATGTAGVISASNSVVGSTAGDEIGFDVDPGSNVASGGVIVFPNGHDYLIASPLWKNTATGATHAGAITFVSGVTGLPVGGNSTVSATNSLVGTQTNDLVGVGNGYTGGQFASVIVKDPFASLPDGKIIAFNPKWANGAAAQAGAVTVFDPNNPAATVGPITAANSLIGTTAGDQVGYGAFQQVSFNGASPLYVLGSQFWTNTTTGAANAGAVTFFNPDTPPVGVISTANSIIGSNPGDQVGESDGTFPTIITQLYMPAPGPNGTTIADPTFANFLLTTPHWNNGRGAITTVLVNGAGWTTADGTHTVSATNSLVGSQADAGATPGDRIGQISPFSNDVDRVLSELGFYAVIQPQWHNNTGAVIWGNPTVASVGVVGANNALVGAQAGDQVGSGGVVIGYQPDTFDNGVVISPNWANGAIAGAGAVTFVNRSSPPVGVVGQSNSLVGDQANEHVGSGGLVSAYPDFLVSTPGYKVGGVAVGAMTSLNPFTGEALDLRNIVSTGNSVVGDAANPNGLTYGGSAYQGGGQHDVFLSPSFEPSNAYFLDTHADATLPSDVVFLVSGAAGQLTVGFTQPPQVQTIDFGLAPGSTVYIPPGVLASLLRQGDNVSLEANTDISLLSPLVVNNPNGDGGTLFLGAGRSIILNASITTDNGNLTLVGNDTAADGVTDSNRDAGQATITMATGTSINAGTGNVSISLKDGAGRTKTDGGAISVGSITARTISITNAARNPGVGEVIVQSGAHLTASGSGTPLVVAGGKFTNLAGANAFSVIEGARFVVYSHDWDADTRGGLSGQNLYNRSLTSNPPGSLGGTGNLFVYERQPILTVTAQDASRQFGDPNPNFTASIAGLVNGDSAGYAYGGAPAVGSPATPGSNVGDYAIVPTIGSLASAVGYGFAFVNGNLTVTTRAVTAVTVSADNKSKTYGSQDPALTFQIAAGSLFGDDTFSGALTRDAGENVGDYAIRQGTLALSSNYTLTFINGVLSITPATLTYNATPKHRTYGDANPAFSGTVSGFVNNDTLANATGGTLAFTSTANTSTHVGQYAINGSGLTANNGNYVFVQAAGNATALTIDPATLSYLANAASRIYGDANPAFTGTVTGFKNEDSAASATTGTLTFTSPANGQTNVGQAAINGSGLTATNSDYVFAQAAANASALTITPATLTYVASATHRGYGDANPAFGGTVSGLKNQDTLAGSTTGALTFTSPANAQSGVGQYAINGSGLNSTNYVFVQAAGNATALTIDPAVLAYVANATSRTYGDANPALTGTVSGLKNEDTLSAVATGTATFASSANTGSHVGQYAINGSGLTVTSGNYVLTQAAGNATALTINPATLAYTANAAARTYGDANPAFSGTVTGFKNEDSLASATTGTLTFTSPATTATGVGKAAINGSGLAAGDYVFVQAAGNATALTINPATLTYVANAASRFFGEPNPAFTGTVTGFKLSDTQAGATTGALIFSSPATGASAAGAYAINGSGLASANYVFVQSGGNATALTIKPLPSSRSVRPTLRSFLQPPADPNLIPVDPQTGDGDVNPVDVKVGDVAAAGGGSASR